ncbi:serine/threonine-protein kinase PknD [Mycobacterium heckeshornense]|uniref:serine/threonine-protein kinase n=1 Tax=Mycobacterium heckeshornense TaxID=110505 RepID=UPI00194333FC|nr:serine/threonine-protein kinase [Mycobacterium heckeshornense]BCQ08403.1 serine/threonine-protein kinase PknD [Mycobacterium heckeshornense]
MPLAHGATAAGFKIVRLLGSGPASEVYLAEHPRLPRRHALRILSEEVSADPEYRARFIRESDLAAALWHPHIVGLHDRGECNERLWLSVDYIDGTTAAQLVSESYPKGMPPHLVVEIVTGIAHALDYAHDHGLLHRRVKPGNILITRPCADERRIVLADLGIAQIDDINGLTATNLTVGSVSYGAPEQLMDSSVDGRTDQYALACTAFHLLTGSPPFAHGNPAVVISKHLNESPPLPGDVRPELAPFDQPISRALAKAPDERFPRCRDFADALRAGQCEPSVLATAPGPPATGAPADPETDAAATAPPGVAERSDTQGAAVAPSVPAPADLADNHGPAPSEPMPNAEIGDAVTSAEPAISGAMTDDRPVASRGRLMPRAVPVVLAVGVVLIGFVVVMALHSRSGFHRAPTDVETPPAATSAPPAAPMPVTVTSVSSAPAPLPAITPPPTIGTPAPTTTTPSQVATVRTPSVTTRPPTTMPSSPTAPVAGIDSRPAVGMPCSPQQTGATTISNSGAPVSCVGTPGGFAWEPAGG